MTLNHTVAQRRADAVKQKPRLEIRQAQEQLYRFLLEIVKTWTPDEVLQEFKRIYIRQSESASSEIVPALYQLLFANQEEEFRHTLKRSCYILINNWEISRNYQAIHQLIELFSDGVLEKPTMSRTLKRLRLWIRNFVESQDFQELKLFATRHEERGWGHWSHRYVPYLLVSQYINTENPLEQRQAARNLYVQMKEQFKFDLAMYTAHSSQQLPNSQTYKNPTFLGDDVLLLIQKIVAKRGIFGYSSLAQIFLKQVEHSSYGQFKQSLLEYLIFSVAQNEVSAGIKQYFYKKLSSLYTHHDLKETNPSLQMRTVNKVIDYLTIANGQEPSNLFGLLVSNGSALTLVIMLLKLVLISPHSRVHLEARIADLLKYYEQYSEEECQWVIHFLEIFNITMTIHAENVEYNLVTMSNDRIPNDQKPNDQKPNDRTPQIEPVNGYRIFSQLKQHSAYHPKTSLIQPSKNGMKNDNQNGNQNVKQRHC
jgi:hypothetical protein